MSMTLDDMATLVARQGLGGQNTSAVVELAKDAIRAALEDWNAAKSWNFLLKDTADGFRVAGCNCTSGSATVSAPSTGAFDGVNVGVTVTVLASDTVTLAASTTVSSITRNTDGTVASITLSANFGGTNDTSTTLIFSGDIPIRVGVDEYNLPTDMGSPHSTRLLVDKRHLEFILFREWNRKVVDQTVQGVVEAYTIYNPISPLTQNYGTYRLRVFRIPAKTDTLRMQYFRKMDRTATTVDIPDEYLYMFIDMAIWRLVRIKNTEDSRLPALHEAAVSSLSRAMSDDEENVEDQELRIISQLEAWDGERVLWQNGPFWPLDY